MPPHAFAMYHLMCKNCRLWRSIDVLLSLVMLHEVHIDVLSLVALHLCSVVVAVPRQRVLSIFQGVCQQVTSDWGGGRGSRGVITLCCAQNVNMQNGYHKSLSFFLCYGHPLQVPGTMPAALPHQGVPDPHLATANLLPPPQAPPALPSQPSLPPQPPTVHQPHPPASSGGPEVDQPRSSKSSFDRIVEKLVPHYPNYAR